MFSCKLQDKIELRLLDPRHAGELFQLVEGNLDRLSAWCPWLDAVRTIESTHDFLREKIGRFAAGNGFTAGIFDDDRLAGVISLERVDWRNSFTEIGYWIDSRVEGKGIVTKACSAVVDHAVINLRLNRVQIRCAVGNLRSRAVPERLGFSQEGIIRQAERLSDRYVDLVIYGMLSSDWKNGMSS